jgi:predicted phage tail protein
MTLRSESSIHILDLLCEGTIEGWGPDDNLMKKGTFLNETPVMDADGTENFGAVDVELKNGTYDQDTPLYGSTVSTQTSVGVEVGENYNEQINSNGFIKNGGAARSYGGGSVSRTITNTNTDHFSCLFSIPRLFSTAADGLAANQLFNATICIEITAKGPLGTVSGKETRMQITGIATSTYQVQSPEIEIKTRCGYPCTVTVKKLNYIYIKNETFTGTRGEEFTYVPADLDGPEKDTAIKAIDTGNLDRGREAMFEANYQSIDDKTIKKRKISLQNGRGNQLIWQSLQESQKVTVRYANTACASLTIGTKDFSSLPTRAYLIKGIKVQIPNNMTARDDGSLERIAQTDFNGTSKGQEEWTTCPVCIWRHLLLSERFGAGSFVNAENVSWVDLYPLILYANELITLPDGTTEPRFACNTVVSNQANAFEVLQDFASVFRGMLYWQTNGITAAGDHGELGKTDGSLSVIPPVHVFNNSNVLGGQFEYEGTSVKVRSTTVKVRYNNPDDLYRSDTVCVENSSLREKIGHQVKEIVGFGCTSRTQAARLARWVLASEELDSNVVKFATGLDGAVVVPGQVFAVSDEMRAGDRIAGRVQSATTTAITLDANVTLPSGSGTELTCVLNHGTVETKAFDPSSSTVANGVRTIVVSSAFSEAPQPQSIYSISSSTVNEQKFRCLAVADNGDGTYAIVGVEHNDSIYSVADVAGNQLYEEPISTYTSRPSPPENLNVTFRPVQTSGNLVFQALVSWDRGATGVTTGYELSITTGTSGLRETLKGQYKEVGSELFIPPRGVFIAQVKAVGLSGSDFSKEVTKITLAPDAGVLQSAKFIPAEDVAIVPPDITDLSVRMTNEVTAQVQFGEVIDPSSEFFKVVIRYSETATSWGATTFVAEFPARTQSYMIPYRPGVYYAKLRDIRTNAQSTNAAQVSALDISDISRLLIKSQLFDGSLLTTGTIRENLRATADADSTFSGVHDAQVKKRNNKLILGQSISSATQVRGSYTQNGTAITITPSFGYKQFDFVNLSISGAARLDSFNSPFVVASANDTSFTVTSGTSRSITTAENVFISPAVKEGTYFFNNQVDMGSKYEVVLTAIAKNETADVRGITNVQLYFRTSDTAPGTDNVGDENQTSSDLIVYEDNDTMLTESNATDFTEWQPFTAKFATGRVFQFKAVLSTEIPSIAPEISELGVDVELLERVEVSDEKQTVSTLAALNNSHYYINSFYQTPSLSASFVDPSQVNSGDILQVSAERFFAYVPSTGTYPVVQAGEAFEVKALSSANAFLVRKYRYTATGYGKKLPANPT